MNGPTGALELTVKVFGQSWPISGLTGVAFSSGPAVRLTEKPAWLARVKAALPLPSATTFQGAGRLPSQSSRKRAKSFDASLQGRPTSSVVSEHSPAGRL